MTKMYYFQVKDETLHVEIVPETKPDNNAETGEDAKSETTTENEELQILLPDDAEEKPLLAEEDDGEKPASAEPEKSQDPQQTQAGNTDRVKEPIKVDPALLTRDSGQIVANEIKAFAFIECSAKTKEGVRDVFEAAVKATKRDNKQCILL